MVTAEIPSIAFGPLGRPREEELRFWRLIEEREAFGSAEVVRLACGHIETFKAGIPDSQEYAYCPQCVAASRTSQKGVAR